MRAARRDLRPQDMTRRDFEAVPPRSSWTSDEEPFDELVILPGRRVHDSGYRCLDFVGFRKGRAICRLAGGSDVLHIDGIGGPAVQRYLGHPVNDQTSWVIDCLPTSGLLRLWNDHGQIRVSVALSSFEIFAVDRPGRGLKQGETPGKQADGGEPPSPPGGVTESR